MRLIMNKMQMVKTIGYLIVALIFFKLFHEKIVENYLSTAKSVSRHENFMIF